MRIEPTIIGRPRGRPRGSKNKKPIIRVKGKLVGAVDRPLELETKAQDFYSAIYALHLANIRPKVIAQRTGVSVETVRSVIKHGDQALRAEDRTFLIDIVRVQFMKAVDNHRMISNEHTICFITTQLQRDKCKVKADRLACEARLRLIGRELTNSNKAFVDILCRMGVPGHTPTTTNGSHTQDSPDTNFYDTLSIDEAEVETIKTVEKQLVHLKKQKRDREKEKNDTR